MELIPKKEADRIRIQFWGEDLFPVDPVTICLTLGIEVVDRMLPKDISSALIKEIGKDPVISLHETDSDNRKRFSCAHELGHFVYRTQLTEINSDDYAYIDYRSNLSSEGTDRSEIFANQFAANLLIPEEAVKNLVKEKKSPLEMAIFFDVSAEAIKYRLRSLRIE